MCNNYTGNNKSHSFDCAGRRIALRMVLKVKPWSVRKWSDCNFRTICVSHIIIIWKIRQSMFNLLLICNLLISKLFIFFTWFITDTGTTLWNIYNVIGRFHSTCHAISSLSLFSGVYLLVTNFIRSYFV